MAHLRTGTYGSYYGSFYDESESLSPSQMQVNATYIYSALKAKGWSQQAIAALLGNMQHESAINPGRWEADDVNCMTGGYGLVQWTPATNYIDWCSGQGFSDPSEMDHNLARIQYEMDNGLQYYATTSYPYDFEEFSKSTKDPYELGCAFAWNYERSRVVLYGSEEEKEALRQLRGGSANSWYSYLSGVDPDIPINPDPDDPEDPDLPFWPSWGFGKKKGFKFLLFGAQRRRTLINRKRRF